MARPKTLARAFYDGVLGGILLGIAIASLYVLYMFGQSGYPVPIDVQYGAFILLIFGIIVVAYDAHRVTSAPSS